MKTTPHILVLAGSLLTGSVLAQQQTAASLNLFVYPSGGQTAEQQTKDEQECYAWAQQQTGIDPTKPAAAQPAPPAEQQGSGGGAGRGAVRGAAAGALIGEVTDSDVSEAAAVGAVVGAGRGARASRQRNAQAQQQATQQQQQAAEAQVQTFKNAFSACVEGRNYTIK